MTDLRKAAIELLKSAQDHVTGHWPELDDVVKALAQPEQAPVGMTCKVWTHGCALFDGIDLPNETLLYTAPPSKPWVSLTNKEIADAQAMGEARTFRHCVRWVEAALRSKNNG